MIVKVVPVIILILLLAGLYYPRCALCINMCKLVNNRLKLSDILQSLLPIYNIHFSNYVATGKKTLTLITTIIIWILMSVSGYIRLFMSQDVLANLIATVLLLVVPVLTYIMAVGVNGYLMWYFNCKKYWVLGFLPVATNLNIITGAKMYLYESKHEIEGTFDADDEYEE